LRPNEHETRPWQLELRLPELHVQDTLLELLLDELNREGFLQVWKEKKKINFYQKDQKYSASNVNNLNVEKVKIWLNLLVQNVNLGEFSKGSGISIRLSKNI